MKRVNGMLLAWGIVITLGPGMSTGWSAEASAGSDWDELPVVLSASRLSQSFIASPSAISIIDRKMIEASGARQIADLMRYVPGATVGYNDGNRPVVTLRGLSGVYASGLQVLIDGVSVYSPLWGGMQWEDIPLALEDVERIEVVRGPNAAIFGPNSFSGVINIITREPGVTPGQSLNANVGRGEIRDIAFHHEGASGQGWRYRLTLGDRSSQGFDTRPDSQSYSFGNFRGDTRISAADTVQTSLRWASQRKDNGDYTALGTQSQPHPVSSNQVDAQVRWTHAASADDEWWIQYYHQDIDASDKVLIDLRDNQKLDKAFFTAFGLHLYQSVIPIPFLVSLEYSTQRDGIEFQQVHRWNDELRTVWGLETRRDAAQSYRLFANSNPQTSSLTRGFANAEWHFFPRWTLHAAAMFERNSLAESAWSPKISLNWEALPGQVLRLSGSQALRTPTLLEKYADYKYQIPSFQVHILPFPVISVPGTTLPVVKSSGQLQSEKVRSLEAGYAFSVPGTRITGDARWFVDRYRGLMKGDTGDFLNTDSAEIEGGDFTMNWDVTDATRFRFSLARTHISANDRDLVMSAPKHTVSLLLDHRLDELTRVSANYQRVGPMFWTDSGKLAQQIIPLTPIEYLNLRLSRAVAWGSQRGEVALVLQNALGQHEEYYKGLPTTTAVTVAQRLAFLQLALKF